MPARSGTETRERIHEAAGMLFREHGYAGTSVRDIAARAGADPALVIRHFGSKELLFLDTMHLTMDDEPLLDVPLEALGARFIALLLDGHERTRGVYLALVRGSGTPQIAERLRSVHETTFIRPLRARMSGADAELRARLAADERGGQLSALWVVGDERLATADRAAVVDRYGALLQRLLTP